MTTNIRLDLCERCYFAVLMMFMGNYVICTYEVTGEPPWWRSKRA